MYNFLPRLRKLESLVQERPDRSRMLPFERDPHGYAREILRVAWWHKQKEIAECLLTPPYKALVPSGHSVGKTFLAAGLTQWWYDTRPESSAVITTAPTSRDVQDLLWTEVRLQRQVAGLGGFRGNTAPELRAGPGHFAKGFTAAKGESFQGRHLRNMLFLFDEAVGIQPVFWTTTKSMFVPSGQHAWCCFFNPTDSSTQAYAECLRALDGYPERGWHLLPMSALDHPNIAEELAGRPPVYPGAVRLAQVDEWVGDWCNPIDARDKTATDIEWRPRSGKWYRPGPLFECRALGLWPSQSTSAVWSEALLKAVLRPFTGEDRGSTWTVEIGCDPARHGDDFTAIHVRRGPYSLHHEAANGWETGQTAGRLKQLAKRFADEYNCPPLSIPIKVDPDGLGWGVIDQRGEYMFIPVSSTATAVNQRDYPDRRSELWFNAAKQAKKGLVDWSRLDRSTLARLRQQAMQPQWKVDADGTARVEKKEETKKRLGRSPDDMDAVNLAYWTAPRGEAFAIPRKPRELHPEPGTPEARQRASKRRGLFGS